MTARRRQDDPTEGVSRSGAPLGRAHRPPVDPRIVVPDSPVCAPGRSSSSARPRSSPLGAAGDVVRRRRTRRHRPGSAPRSRTTPRELIDARRRRPTTSTASSTSTADIGDVAPLAIEPHWQALVLNYETASTVDMADPESVQRAAGAGLRDRALGRRGQGVPARQLQRRPRPDRHGRAAGRPAATGRRPPPAEAGDAAGQVRQTGAISPRRLLTSSQRPYSTACSAVNQRSRSESAWICSSVLPEWKAISSAIRRFV